MAKKWFLRIEIEKSNGNKRKIFISTPKEKLDSYTRKVKDPIQEKPEHNNTRWIILNTNVFNKNNSIVLYKEKTLLESKIEEFEKYRREIKKPLCPISKVAMLKKLALFDEETAICMLDTSIMNGWQWVFPLRIEKWKNRDVMQNMASFNIT